MFTILDDMFELIYVVSIESHEILYFNAKGRETFGIGEEVIGQKCYRIIHGKDSPCSFCPNALLKDKDVHIWEITNPVVKRHYLLKDRLIDWNGAPAKIEIAFDNTENENEKIALKRRLEAEELVMRCIRRLYLSPDLSEEIPVILQEVGTFFRAQRAYMFQIQNHKMYNTFEWCAAGIESQKDNLQGLDESLIDCWKPYFCSQECYILPNLEDIRQSDPDTYRVLHAQNIQSLVTVPLELEGQLIGYMGMDNPEKEMLEEISLMLHALRYFIMASIRRMADEANLRKLSYFDPLTGAYNRNRYMKDIQELCKKKGPIGIAYLDINGLKDINDQMGHPYGDQIILTTSQLINEAFGAGYLYRVGGDEFVVLSGDYINEESFLQRIWRLKKRFEVTNHCSVAIGYRWSENAGNIERDVSLAELMMYEDKKQYYRGSTASGRYRHYNDDLLGLTDPKVLQKELENGRFHVFLQPKMSFVDRRLTGAEALVRYRAPSGELIAPAHFLPKLEDIHLISKIDFYVFESICKKIAQWNKKGIRVITVSVNFSRDSISEMDFIDRLAGICQKYNVDQKYLEIEITESAESLRDFDLRSFSAKLRKAGFRISIDDFGVQYANLSLLTSIEFDKLKIDKSLIDTLLTNYKTQSVCHALSNMCCNMQIGTTVEGVETETQFKLLQDMGFEEAQGYLFNCPIPINEFEKRYLCCAQS